MARERREAENGRVYDVPFAALHYREVRMVSDDGVLLVEIRVHERAREGDLVPEFRAWLARIEEREARKRSPLSLVTPAGERAS